MNWSPEYFPSTKNFPGRQSARMTSLGSTRWIDPDEDIACNLTTADLANLEAASVPAAASKKRGRDESADLKSDRPIKQVWFFHVRLAEPNVLVETASNRNETEHSHCSQACSRHRFTWHDRL
jgi:hypothetical protein